MDLLCAPQATGKARLTLTDAGIREAQVTRLDRRGSSAQNRASTGAAAVLRRRLCRRLFYGWRRGVTIGSDAAIGSGGSVFVGSETRKRPQRRQLRCTFGA